MPQPTLAPQSFREIEFSPLRQLVETNLQARPKGFGFCGIITCDIQRYEDFAQRCHRARCRPPGLYAYFSRCLGVLLHECPELLAVRLKKKLLIPSRVDAVVAVEMNAYDGAQIPGTVYLADLGGRALNDIAEELKVGLRRAKRTVMQIPTERRRFVPLWAPDWWRHFVKALRDSRSQAQRERAMQNACIQLSSTTQWMNGKSGWGVQLYNTMALSVTLAGSSRRPTATDNDEIVLHRFIDVVLNFNHIITDGAPATRFIAALIAEVESGRLLEEYPVIVRKSRPTRATNNDVASRDRIKASSM